jgi:uncharacterized protein YndB with AHSA1/START domain
MNTTTLPIILKLNRLIKAPRERVFAAWTTPADIQKWLGGEGCLVSSAQVDLRVGGEYRFSMKSAEGGKSEAFGIYRVINPPSQLVFTWNSKGCCAGMENMDTQVTVDFIEQKDGTEVQITHEGFPDEEIRERHNYGWTGSLDKLEKLA